MEVLLVHPPLLAPVVFSRLAPLLVGAGHHVAVPDLGVAFSAGAVQTWWQRAAQAAAASMPGAQVILAHSGAGVVVPALCHLLPRCAAVVLIDAVLPPASGVHTTPAPVRAMVAGLAVGGVLPPWTSWWPPQEMAALVPDAGDRQALSEAAPALPEALYDVDVPAAPGWEPALRAYLRLSPAYQGAAEQAGARGWHVEHHDGAHLDVLTRAGSVAATVERVLGRARA